MPYFFGKALHLCNAGLLAAQRAKEYGQSLNQVFVLRLTKDEGIKRIMARASLDGRNDDTPKSIARRLQLYHEQTEPIINYFKRLGKVVEINGAKTIEEVTADINNQLQ